MIWNQAAALSTTYFFIVAGAMGLFTLVGGSALLPGKREPETEVEPEWYKVVGGLHLFGAGISLSVLLALLIRGYLQARENISSDDYIVFISLFLVIVSIVLAVRQTPKRLIVALGAALGFLFAAYAYDAWIALKAVIENLAEQSGEL
jgi:hypothetical protein